MDLSQKLVAKLNDSGSKVPLFTGESMELRLWMDVDRKKR